MNSETSSNKTTNTPTPWSVNKYGYIHGDVQPSVFGSRLTTLVAIIASELEAKAAICQAALPDEGKANAELIVRAVNAQEALVEACRLAFDEACKDNNNQELIDQLDAALTLARAEGKRSYTQSQADTDNQAIQEQIGREFPKPPGGFETSDQEDKWLNARDARHRQLVATWPALTGRHV